MDETKLFEMKNQGAPFLIASMLWSVLTFYSNISLAQKSKKVGKKAQWVIKHTSDFAVAGDTLTDAWKNTSWVKLSQSDGSEKKRMAKAKLLYSDTGIYGLFWCEDALISATLKEDFADLYNEDVVEAFFWPDEDHPLYFEYELSPLNYELAILVPNMKGNFFGWRPWHYETKRLTRHATRVTKSSDTVTGWVAEFFIPFELLKPLNNVPPKRGTQWRGNLYRIDYDSGSAEWYWQPVTTNFHDIKNFGTFVFD
jgi:hypothetical protein